MISMFMQGGPSHVDLFDRKDELIKHHMQEYSGGDFKFDSVDQASRKLYAPQWKIKRYGQCGLEMSELLPHLGSVADDICLIRSMKTGVNNHGHRSWPCSQARFCRQAVARLVDDLSLGQRERQPARLHGAARSGVVPVEGVYNWSNGWLPALYQGPSRVRKSPRIPNLIRHRT